ncbi:CcdC family protein [Ammoniphilus sp. CFH 90114]|uniref:CcdC family protein n=1 Tax=Ammoniphilus sp. CFH 90114 TaxID=2493665 RepID=UPI00100EABDE|nr:cytochrome c biogenesis protein CcdC [Ammoniphilus sp. CFH 90114]RXT15237.1 cytochrome c biogenesis protein CcdC [Ammoniphilus sp. CFH 90114]
MTIMATLLSILMMFIVMFARIKRDQQPTSLKRIILPPIFMSTGFIMFLFPPMHVQFLYAVESLLIGMLLSIPLILTSKFEINGSDIFLKRSRSFMFILMGLFLLRLGMRFYLEEYVSFYEAGGLFYILAVGMIFPWRVAMAYKYKQLLETRKKSSPIG